MNNAGQGNVDDEQRGFPFERVIELASPRIALSHSPRRQESEFYRRELRDRADTGCLSLRHKHRPAMDWRDPRFSSIPTRRARVSFTFHYAQHSCAP